MATLTNPRLILQCSERWRPRAEAALGLILTAAEVLPVLQGIACEGGSEEIPCGEVPGQRPFTRDHFLAFTGLLAQLAALTRNETVMAALHGLRIRTVRECLPMMPEAGRVATLEGALLNVIRPLARLIRAQRRAADDDARITPLSLEGLSSEDVIDEGQPDGRSCLVGHIRLLHAMSQQMVAEGNTAAVADATDAACTSPLEVK